MSYLLMLTGAIFYKGFEPPWGVNIHESPQTLKECCVCFSRAPVGLILIP